MTNLTEKVFRSSKWRRHQNKERFVRIASIGSRGFSLCLVRMFGLHVVTEHPPGVVLDSTEVALVQHVGVVTGKVVSKHTLDLEGLVTQRA